MEEDSVVGRAMPDNLNRRAQPALHKSTLTSRIGISIHLPPMTNADPIELEKFSQLAHKWWDPHSEFKPLHDINPLRLDYIDRHAGLAGKTVLDVGCGGGSLSCSSREYPCPTNTHG